MEFAGDKGHRGSRHTVDLRQTDVAICSPAPFNAHDSGDASSHMSAGRVALPVSIADVDPVVCDFEACFAVRTDLCSSSLTCNLGFAIRFSALSTSSLCPDHGSLTTNHWALTTENWKLITKNEVPPGIFLDLSGIS
jgi:hypothetical protein